MKNEIGNFSNKKSITPRKMNNTNKYTKFFSLEKSPLTDYKLLKAFLIIFLSVSVIYLFKNPHSMNKLNKTLSKSFNKLSLINQVSKEGESSTIYNNKRKYITDFCESSCLNQGEENTKDSNKKYRECLDICNSKSK